MALPTSQEWAQTAGSQYKFGVNVIMSGKGTTDEKIYPVLVDPDTGAIAVTVGGLAPETFRGLTVNYPSATQEVYLFYSDAAKTTLIGTVTVDYSDATKARVTSAVRT